MALNGPDGLADRINTEIWLSGATASIYFEDLLDGELLAINAERSFPLASVIKLPIMVYLMHCVAAGKLALEDRIPLDLGAPEFSQLDGSGVLTYLSSPIALSIRDLIALMMIDSDNLATNVLLDQVSMDAINATLKQIGCKQTHVTHRILDFPALRQPGSNAGTARDLGRLLRMIYRRELPYSDLMLEFMKEAKFNSRIPFFLPTDDDRLAIAHKTGSLNGLVHDAGLIWTPDFAYSITILLQHSMSGISADLLSARISEIIFQAVRSKYSEQSQKRPKANE